MKCSIKLLALAVGMLCSIHSVHAVPQIPYYQQVLLNERVGFGQNATGGAGGEVWWVTNLNDSGPGSLREAVSGDDARWIMFAVSGNILLSTQSGRIYIGSNKTIDGRGASISIYNYGLVVQTRNVIIENLNLKNGVFQDGVEVSDGGGDVWIDHCSFSNLEDEAIGVSRPQKGVMTDVTISWCKFFNQTRSILIGSVAGWDYGANSRVTLHHNWFDHTDQRNPRLRTALVHAFNNYLHGWQEHGMAVTDSGELRVENNIFHSTDGNLLGVTTDGGDLEDDGYSNSNNNWRIPGAVVIEERLPVPPAEMFWPPNFYNFTLEAPDLALVVKIQTRAGATRSSVGFVNMSTRANVQSGEGVLISGMFVTGPESKKVVIRAIGPSMAPLPGVMLNPHLRLYNGAGQEIAFNDNWRDTQEAELVASGLAPSNNLEAAMIRTLTPDSYTAMITGWGTGIASIEVYDVDPSGPAKLLNISSRATVDPNSPPIAGLIAGAGLTKLLLRGIGPSMGSQGVNNPIQDPTLELRDSNGVLITSNNNWEETQSKEISDTGLAPTDADESAILINLVPGTYTAILRNVLNVTGIGLIEAYRL